MCMFLHISIRITDCIHTVSHLCPFSLAEVMVELVKQIQADAENTLGILIATLSKLDVNCHNLVNYGNHFKDVLKKAHTD